MIELMIAIAVLAILAGLALPSFRTAVQNNRITVHANEMVTAFHLARSEALKRNRPVVVCASNDGSTCSGAWADGWLVAEVNAVPGNAAQSITNIIRVWPAPEGGTTFTVMPNAASFRFLSQGRMDAELLVFPATIDISIPGCTGERARSIRINQIGRVTVETVACT